MGESFHVLARLQNFEKGLLASSCLSARLHGKTLLPLDGLVQNLIGIIKVFIY
jgi:hypothetical protein